MKRKVYTMVTDSSILHLLYGDKEIKSWASPDKDDFSWHIEFEDGTDLYTSIPIGIQVRTIEK